MAMNIYIWYVAWKVAIFLQELGIPYEIKMTVTGDGPNGVKVWESFAVLVINCIVAPGFLEA